MRFLPTEAEMKLLRQYERDRKPLEALSEEDRFMMQFSRIERLNQRMSIMIFMGNFSDNIQMLTPVRLTQTSRNSCNVAPLECVEKRLLGLEHLATAHH